MSRQITEEDEKNEFNFQGKILYLELMHMSKGIICKTSDSEMYKFQESYNPSLWKMSLSTVDIDNGLTVPPFLVAV